MTNNEMFKEFNELYQVDHLEHTMKNINKTIDLISDELHEAINETIDPTQWFDLPIDQVNRYNLAKELTDILYITMQRMTAMGLDVDALLQEVHRSNMSKQVHIDNVTHELEIAEERYPKAQYIQITETMGVLRCSESGKVIKPTCYSPAVITDAMIGIKG